MFAGGDGARLGIEVKVAALFFQHFLHHIGCGSPGNILVEEDDLVGLFQRLHNAVVDVEGDERLHVDQFNGNIIILQLLNGILGDPYAGAIGDQRDIGARIQDLRFAQG